MRKNKKRICSICGRQGDQKDFSSFGPGDHAFHGVCMNGAWNLRWLDQTTNGEDAGARPLVWTAAEKAGVKDPWLKGREILRRA